ncbi:hypothetical protein QCA50_003652 [Cerrena zonata]|uniref:SNF2 N-terminal domain-containing protein n=1 Tax=Cerrena zonata TaxID=2478898 RepID=A0AAW0GMU5_9APHY
MERSNPICCTRTPLLSPAVVAALCPFDDLRKFLPAGTVSFSVQQEMSTHRHESEHWHYLPSFHELSTIIQDELLLEVLTFLSNHNFIRITCRLGCGPWESRIVLRVYLIPYDLSNVQGKLRTRDETAILVPAREYLQVLLPRLVRSPSEWNLSKDPLSSSDNQHFFTPSTDDRTMAEIYSSLPSPTPDVTLPLFSNITHSDIDGLRSTLHPYQRRSVVAMLTKEIAPPPSNYDPLYVPLTGLDGTVFYFQPTTYELLSERPFVPPAKGGILCEELGTGKTVMILGLITSTIDQLSTPQESIQDDRPVLTPLSFTSFPWSPHITARQRLQKVVKLRQAKSLTTGIPPLKDILIHYLRSQPNGLQMRHYESELEDRLLHETYDKNVPFYLHYNEVLDPLRPRRQKVETKPRIMYLTTATLIIVPVNLLYQWEMEILKHCDDCVRCLVVRNTKPLIPASELATRYDIILMSHTRFSAEANKADIKMLHTWKSCKCSPASSSQPTFASCRCHHHLSVSPLFQVRWKRLVIDEGHVASGLDYKSCHAGEAT